MENQFSVPYMFILTVVYFWESRLQQKRKKRVGRTINVTAGVVKKGYVVDSTYQHNKHQNQA